MDTTEWLAGALARFELPSAASAPPDYEDELVAALLADQRARRAFLNRLRAAVVDASGGRTSLFVGDPTSWPVTSRDLGAAHLVLTGQRRLSLAPAAEPVAFLD